MSRIDISTQPAERRPDVSVISVNGFLDTTTIGELEKNLETHVQSSRVQIVVNFKGLDYISSAGLGVFMGVIDRVRGQNGDIKLACLSPKVFRVFDLLGFTSLFQIVSSVEEAVAAFPPAAGRA